MKYLFTMALMIFALFEVARADSFPSAAVIGSAKEMASINYSCSLSKNESSVEKITCSISYEKVERSSKLLSLEETKREVVGDKLFFDNFCASPELREILHLDHKEVIKSMDAKYPTGGEYRNLHMSGQLPLMKKVCKERNLEAMLELVAYLNKMETETCFVESRTESNIEFIKLDQVKNPRGVWINESRAWDECGMKEVIRFIPVGKKDWEMQYELVSLNSGGVDKDGSKCSRKAGLKNVFNHYTNTWILPCKYMRLTNRGAWGGPFNPK